MAEDLFNNLGTFGGPWNIDHSTFKNDLECSKTIHSNILIHLLVTIEVDSIGKL